MATVCTQDNILTLNVNGIQITYSPETDRRIEEAIDDKVFTKTKEGAVELAAEMQAWGVTEARAFEYAVVFWS